SGQSGAWCGTTSSQQSSTEPSRAVQAIRVEVPGSQDSALQAAIVSSPAPSWAGSKSPGTSDSGGPSWIDRPRDSNQDRHFGTWWRISASSGDRTIVIVIGR